MADAKRERVQLDMPTTIRNRSKAVAALRDMTLIELVLLSLQHEVVKDDPKLAELIKQELKSRRPKGRPAKED